MTANDTDIDGSEAARLEHRLTKLEHEVATARAEMAQGFTGVNKRLDDLNGSTRKAHERMNVHDVAHAKADGAREEYMRLRLLDRSLIVVSALAGVTAVIVGAVLK